MPRKVITESHVQIALRVVICF